jgi:hypothetical protein
MHSKILEGFDLRRMMRECIQSYDFRLVRQHTSIHKIMDAVRRSRKLLYNSGSDPNDDIRPIIQATKGFLNTIKLNYSIL